ncbi:hypothetical protein KI688_009576 [Linnemannia hyalina]|uniref:VWFA domain-containing protein n=1 Tax=Linnemannia hyalina TaxID=64524 RepID=A0A9P8BWI7_9FUNG|nr:hypothetical protein KI688_009576 [Linnemannia hyalina]
MTGSLEFRLRKNGSNPQRIIKSLRERPKVNAQNSAEIPPPRATVNSVLKTDFQNIAGHWQGVSAQMAQRLCKLALYDVVLLVDDSSSIRMHNEDDGRLDDLELMASIIAEATALFDDDGIDIEFLNGHALREKVHRRFFRKASSTDTPLKLRKPFLVFIITDGASAGEPEHNLERQIRKASEYLMGEGYSPDFFRYQIVQVGRNRRASEFLQDLKEQLVVEEFVDVTSRYGVEKRQLALMGFEPTPELYLVKLLFGAIDGRFY